MPGNLEVSSLLYSIGYLILFAILFNIIKALHCVCVFFFQQSLHCVDLEANSVVFFGGKKISMNN